MFMKKNIIYLTGFMGAGKSTVGPILANTLGLDFYDLDKVIEEKLGKKVSDIFKDHGEEFFRKEETNALLDLSALNDTIISLGGGTMAYNNNIKILKETGKIIYLKASINSIFKRLEFKTDRPNLKVEGEMEKAKEKLLKKIEDLFKSREKFYNQSDIIVKTDNVPVGITVDEIVKIINAKNQKTKHRK